MRRREARQWPADKPQRQHRRGRARRDALGQHDRKQHPKDQHRPSPSDPAARRNREPRRRRAPADSHSSRTRRVPDLGPVACRSDPGADQPARDHGHARPQISLPMSTRPPAAPGRSEAENACPVRRGARSALPIRPDAPIPPPSNWPPRAGTHEDCRVGINSGPCCFRRPRLAADATQDRRSQPHGQ